MPTPLFRISSAALALTVLLSSAGAAPGRDVFGRVFSEENMIPAGSKVCHTRDALDTRPVLLQGVKPLYPIIDNLNGQAGSVVIGYRVGEDGKTTIISKETKGDRNTSKWFGNHAVIAVASWTFEPGRREGVPVAVNCEIGFTFDFN